MAKQRLVNTKFWSDTYVSNLDPTEKLLFLYFITNEKTNIAGIYEVPLKFVAMETGIEKEMIEKIIKRFAAEEKIYYIDGWVFVRNFQKHQTTSSSKVRTGIDIEMAKVPDRIRAKIKGICKGG